MNSWFEKGWSVSKDFDLLPTLTKPVAVKKVRWHTPGNNTADEAMLACWRADMHRRPPIHYQAKYMLDSRDASGKIERRFTNITEDEARRRPAGLDDGVVQRKVSQGGPGDVP